MNFYLVVGLQLVAIEFSNLSITSQELTFLFILKSIWPVIGVTLVFIVLLRLIITRLLVSYLWLDLRSLIEWF